MTKNKKMRPCRFAHTEGHTDICYTDDGKYVLTCGTDGEVRVFNGLDDDDCKTFTAGDCAYAIASRGNRYLVTTDNNFVQACTLDDGSPDGVITRFTAPATHVVYSQDGRTIAAAGSDMTIRVYDVPSSSDKILYGHSAPVLSVAIDSKGEFIASSSCDGSVRVWSRASGNVVQTWDVVPRSNSFQASKTLCRLCFAPRGGYLYVPVNACVHVYERSSWKLVHTLRSDNIKEMISIVTVSPCGGYVAAGCHDGTVVLWDVMTRDTVLAECHPKEVALSGLVWNPSRKGELAFVDVHGQFGTLEGVLDDLNELEPITLATHQLSDSNRAMSPFPPMDVNDFEDDNEISLAQIKSQMGFADDEVGTYLGVPTGSRIRGDDDLSVLSGPVATTSAILSGPVMKLTEPQKAFQPGMSPDELTERYMVWNNIGIVRQYTNEEENSVDVEFHDTAIHHSLHLNNQSGHSMAALSGQALALACEAQEDQPSKLVVQHFGSFDTNREWFVDIPSGEDILCLCIGTDWVAVATDRRYVRIFSTAGYQRDLLTLAGQPVCVTAFQDLLMVVFHSGMGIAGDQCLSMIVLNINGKGNPIPLPCPLPLSPQSYLAWAGFSDEGTPVVMDSVGLVHLMHFKFGPSWTTILNTKSHTKGKSDNYFLLGVCETQSNLRCILCKGSRYPPVLPKPHVSLLDMKLPLCELETEKGGLEEKTIRMSIVSSTLTRLSRRGYDIAETQAETERFIKESFIKMFALACRSDRECRAFEIGQLMPSQQTVQLAIKYAGKQRRLQLADRLGEVASEKLQEELEKQMKPEGEDQWGMYGTVLSVAKRSSSQMDEEEEEYGSYSGRNTPEIESVIDNPLLAAATRRSYVSTKSALNVSQDKRNPFKVTMNPSPSSPLEVTGRKGIQVMDNFHKNMKVQPQSMLSKKPLKKTFTKQTMINQKPKSNSTESTDQVFIDTQDVNDESSIAVKIPETPLSKRVSALQLWLIDNKENVKEKFPQSVDSELLSKAALLFQNVEDGVKQKYKNLAASQNSNISNIGRQNEASQNLTTQDDQNKNDEQEISECEERKRKNQTDDEAADPVKKVRGSGVSKLAAFAFGK